jgi:predicted kinase
MPKCIILRGISGAGKTSYARRLLATDGTFSTRGACIVSIDEFFIKQGGEYKFDERQIGEAVATCMQRFLRALKSCQNVIVDNTNTRRWEYEQYIIAAELAKYEVEIHELPCLDLETLRRFARRNDHQVPLHVIGQQFARWEDDARTAVRVTETPHSSTPTRERERTQMNHNQDVVLELIEHTRVIERHMLTGDNTTKRAMMIGYAYLASWSVLTGFTILPRGQEALPRDKQEPIWIGKPSDGHAEKSSAELQDLVEQHHAARSG